MLRRINGCVETRNEGGATLTLRSVVIFAAFLLAAAPFLAVVASANAEMIWRRGALGDPGPLDRTRRRR